jgi:hypothetical protein
MVDLYKLNKSLYDIYSKSNKIKTKHMPYVMPMAVSCFSPTSIQAQS